MGGWVGGEGEEEEGGQNLSRNRNVSTPILPAAEDNERKLKPSPNH